MKEWSQIFYLSRKKRESLQNLSWVNESVHNQAHILWISEDGSTLTLLSQPLVIIFEFSVQQEHTNIKISITTPSNYTLGVCTNQ